MFLSSLLLLSLLIRCELQRNLFVMPNDAQAQRPRSTARVLYGGWQGESSRGGTEMEVITKVLECLQSDSDVESVGYAPYCNRLSLLRRTKDLVILLACQDVKTMEK
jgi:hypothetical protein